MALSRPLITSAFFRVWVTVWVNRNMQNRGADTVQILIRYKQRIRQCCLLISHPSLFGDRLSSSRFYSWALPLRRRSADIYPSVDTSNRSLSSTPGSSIPMSGSILGFEPVARSTSSTRYGTAVSLCLTRIEKWYVQT